MCAQGPNSPESESFARQDRLAEAFVAIADTLVSGFDVADLFQQLVETCVELLPVDTAGLMVVDPQGVLRVAASSSERTRWLELMELQNDQGPCLECFRTGRPVLIADLARQGRWPRFMAAAAQAGLLAVYALPMRLRGQTIGALNLFTVRTWALGPTDLRIGQALADIATVAILQHRALQAGAELSAQLQTALTSRTLIEQAKGVLAERGGLDMPAAFQLMRSHARATNRSLTDVARAVVAGAIRLPPG